MFKANIMKRILFLISLFILSLYSLNAQSIWKLNYDFGKPSGDFSNFVSDPGSRGFSLNGNWFLNGKVSLGGTFHWSGYSQVYDRKTYTFDEGALTARIRNSMYFTAILANAQYHIKPHAGVRPYIGLGLGPWYIQQESQPGRFLIQHKNWKFGFSPEAGVTIPFSPLHNWGFNAKFTYNLIPYNVEKISTLTHWGFSFGFVYSGW